MNQINMFLLLIVLIMLLGLYSTKWCLAHYDKLTAAIESAKENEEEDHWDLWDIGWQVSLFICGFIVRSML